VEGLFKIIIVILVSSVKFVGGPTFAYLQEDYQFSFFETVVYCVSGGMLGVWIFTFFSLEIQIAIGWVRRRLLSAINGTRLIIRPGHEEDLVHPLDVRKKIFSKRSRRFVKLWRKYGLLGVAFLTPVVISIPVGTVILNLFEDHKGKIFLYMFFSIVFWSLVLTGFFELFHVANMPELKERVVG
jgi:hypothetical protein